MSTSSIPAKDILHLQQTLYRAKEALADNTSLWIALNRASAVVDAYLVDAIEERIEMEVTK